jgi:hypothetical protein
VVIGYTENHRLLLSAASDGFVGTYVVTEQCVLEIVASLVNSPVTQSREQPQMIRKPTLEEVLIFLGIVLCGLMFFLPAAFWAY